ncbi:hypothetical protein NUV89_22935 [Pseudomonas sp. 18.1.10]|uniref:hypothetical protein n=1 Tax=Pseudomonas sp. 18.1.10 TaxID=2969302 RepID=UPI002150376E|nr:hypothetical protein [Pseudomonas sp. 18.1.10]MCR4541253.1 hypothetical protein [Pseudomonas sp. 18.1.10]
MLPLVNTNNTNPSGIVFGAAHPEGAVRIPGYNALAPHVKTVRDPSLSLIALSGIEPTGPVMVEVPLVLNNTTFASSKVMAGWRIGYVGRYVRAGRAEPVEQGSALRQVLEVLRQAGVQWVAVDVKRADQTLEFTLQACNDIDDLVTRYRLDALVSVEGNAAFQGACASGYRSICIPLEGGMKLWFYGARWSRDSLDTLAQAYRQHASGASGRQG